MWKSQCLRHLDICLIRSLGFNVKQLKYFLLLEYKHESPIFHYSYALDLNVHFTES